MNVLLAPTLATQLGAPPPFSFASIFAAAAAVNIDQPVDNFLNFLTKIFLIVGSLVIAYGGYLLHQGRVSEGLLGFVGGFILAIAIPLMKALIGLSTGT